MHWKGNCLCNGRNRPNTVNKFCKERSQRSQWPFCVFTKQNSKFNTMLTVKHWHDDNIINSHVTSINYSKLKGIVPNLQLARSRPTMQKTLYQTLVDNFVILQKKALSDFWYIPGVIEINWRLCVEERVKNPEW